MTAESKPELVKLRIRELNNKLDKFDPETYNADVETIKSDIQTLKSDLIQIASLLVDLSRRFRDQFEFQNE